MSSPRIAPVADPFILCYVLFWVAVMSPLLNDCNEKPLSHRGFGAMEPDGLEPTTSCMP